MVTMRDYNGDEPVSKEAAVRIKELDDILKEIDGKPRDKQLECARVLTILVESWKSQSGRGLDDWDIAVELMRRRRRKRRPLSKGGY